MTNQTAKIPDIKYFPFERYRACGSRTDEECYVFHSEYQEKSELLLIT
jgi:hypothetical protein